MPKLLGITGGFGAGKSTVGESLKSYGVAVIDADDIVHALLDNCQVVKDAIVERFGEGLHNADGSINHKSLAAIVFADPRARKDLESIVHPAVRDVARKKIEELATESVVAYLVPLLFESGMEDLFDQIWSVDCSYETCMQRIMARNKLSKEEIDRRMQAQLPQKEKNARAHAIVDNSGTLEQTQTQVAALLKKLHSPQRAAEV
jgi:dephospho-CoA kinase